LSNLKFDTSPRTSGLPNAYLVNIKLVTATLLTGNTVAKVRRFMSTIGSNFPSDATFKRYIDKAVYPAVMMFADETKVIKIT
jgi:hypothetical protein